MGGEICAPCCGTGREVTIDCPAACAFLREARFHEVPKPLDEKLIPNQDVRLTEKFIRENETLVFALGLALKRAMTIGGAVDFDAREALEAMTRTYRTLESGLIYETRTPNPYAASIQDKLRDAVEELRQAFAEEFGMQTLRDADVLGALVFIQRLELQYANGRPRGRAFLDFLGDYIPEPKAAAAESPAVIL